MHIPGNPKKKETAKEKIQMFLWKWFVIIVFILLIWSFFVYPASKEDFLWWQPY